MFSPIFSSSCSIRRQNNSNLCIPIRTHRHKPRQICTILSFMGELCEVRIVAWDDDHKETYLLFFLFFYIPGNIEQSFKPAIFFVSKRYWLTFINILYTWLKHNALMQSVPVGPYFSSTSCQKKEFYLCIMCIKFGGHSINCPVFAYYSVTSNWNYVYLDFYDKYQHLLFQKFQRLCLYVLKHKNTN